MIITFSNGNAQQQNLKCNNQQDIIIIIEMYSISYSRNNDVELNLTVGKINFVLPNFTPTTLVLALNTLNVYTLILKNIFQTAQILLHVSLQIFKVNQFNKGAG